MNNNTWDTFANEYKNKKLYARINHARAALKTLKRNYGANYLPREVLALVKAFLNRRGVSYRITEHIGFLYGIDLN
jgi:uncharacterized protein (DUF1501 family)